MNYFAAVRIPAPAGLSEALADAPPELRRFVPDDLHATVAFLGPMDHRRAPRLLEAVQALPFEPVTLRFSRLVALPSRRRPSAISFELEGPGHGQLVRLIGEHRGRLVELAGGRPDDRPPYPHVTVARPPRRLRGAQRRRILGWVDGVEPPDPLLVADRLVLFRSRKNEGRLFEPVDAELASRLARQG